MFKKYKLIILSLIILIIILLSSTIYASSNTISFTGPDGTDYIDIILPDVQYKYFIIDIDDGNYVDFFYSNNPITITDDGYIYSDGLKRKNCMLSKFSNNSNTISWLNAVTNNNYSMCNFKGGPGQSATIICSNDNILNFDGTIFFRQTVLLTDLAKVTKLSNPQQVMKQIITIVPLILVVVVSLVGLRKAWRLLSRILHQA